MQIAIGAVQPAPVQKFEGAEVFDLNSDDLMFLIRVGRKSPELHIAMVEEARRRNLLPRLRGRFAAPGTMAARL